MFQPKGVERTRFPTTTIQRWVFQVMDTQQTNPENTSFGWWASLFLLFCQLFSAGDCQRNVDAELEVCTDCQHHDNETQAEDRRLWLQWMVGGSTDWKGEQLSKYHDDTKCEHLSVENIRPDLFSGKVCVRECAGAWGARPHRPNRYEYLQAWADKGYPGWLKAQCSLKWQDFMPGYSCWSIQCWSLCWHVPSFGRFCHWGGRSLFLPQVYIFNILPDNAWVSFEPPDEYS